MYIVLCAPPVSLQAARVWHPTARLRRQKDTAEDALPPAHTPTMLSAGCTSKAALLFLWGLPHLALLLLLLVTASRLQIW